MITASEDTYFWTSVTFEYLVSMSRKLTSFGTLNLFVPEQLRKKKQKLNQGRASKKEEDWKSEPVADRLQEKLRAMRKERKKGTGLAKLAEYISLSELISPTTLSGYECLSHSERSGTISESICRLKFSKYGSSCFAIDIVPGHRGDSAGSGERSWLDLGLGNSEVLENIGVIGIRVDETEVISLHFAFFFCLGLCLFNFAPYLSNRIFFYYLSGISLGVFFSALLLLYLVLSTFMPRRVIYVLLLSMFLNVLEIG